MAKKTGKRNYVTNQVVKERGTPCVHCGHEFDHKKTNTYPNGNRRVLCGKCGKPFIVRRDF